jgi:hypothetical protein
MPSQRLVDEGWFGPGTPHPVSPSASATWRW